MIKIDEKEHFDTVYLSKENHSRPQSYAFFLTLWRVFADHVTKRNKGSRNVVSYAAVISVDRHSPLPTTRMKENMLNTPVRSRSYLWKTT